MHEATKRMRLTLRPYDRIGRYGGEEFLITAPGCDLSQTMALAESIRGSVSAEPVRTRSGEIDMTVSWGVAIGSGRVGDNSPALTQLLMRHFTEQRKQAATGSNARISGLQEAA